MKKTLIAIFTTLFLTSINYGQEFTPMKSPEVTAFLNANYLPIDESTGKIGVNIPIYEINLDGLSIPISLSYDTGGVKVNAASSSVGLNWTLNASGLISKEVMGGRDLTSISRSNDFTSSGKLYIDYGFLSHIFDQTGFPVLEAKRDTQPDLFYVMAPGLSSKFTHKSDGSAFELSNNANKIESPFYNPPIYDKELFKNIFKFKVISNKGFVYSFKEREYNSDYTRDRSQNSPYNPIIDGFELPIWPVSFTEQQAQDFLANPYFTTDNTESTGLIHLSSIKSPISKKVVNYFYEDTFIVDNNRRIERSISSSENIISQTNFEHDFSKTKILKKIVFPDGVIDFFYQENRLDVRGGKILKKIEIRNNQGDFIKGIVFEQSYFNSRENCTENHCYRLRLNEVKFLDKNQNVLPGYSFDYNINKLPKRFSVDQDFMGFYNGPSGVDEKRYFPKSYYKAGQGKKSILPFPFSGYSMIAGGNASKLPNTSYGKEASLYKIVYPTGGFTIFDFELHTFNFLNTTINSGGLRLKSQSLYEDNGVLQKKITYNYNLPNGKSSGSITNIPRYTSISTTPYNYTTTSISQANSKLELTNSSSISYGRVKSVEQNNGYTINTYTNDFDFPNVTPSNYTLHGSFGTNPSYVLDWFTENLNKGYLVDIFRDFSVKRSQLLSSEVFNQQNELIKSKINEFDYVVYDSFDVYQKSIINNSNLSYSNGSNTGYAKFKVSLTSESFNVKKTIEKQYSSSGILTNEKNYLYNTGNPFIKETQTTFSTGEIVKEKHIYPFNSEASSMPNSTKLNDLNILSPLKTTYSQDSTLVATSLTTFKDYGYDKILPENLKTSKGGGVLSVKKEFHNYDKRGNLTEYSEKDGTHITVLWGYRYQYKIAEIIGVSYSQVLAALNMSNTEELQNLSNSALKVKLNNLRTALPNAQVYSYIHIPLVGVIEITNPNGVTNSSSYDSFNRLQFVKDKNNNIVKRNTYNYKLSPTAGNIHQEGLNLEIKKQPTDFYEPVQSAGSHKTKVVAFVNGGKGDYIYQWTLVGSSTILADEYDYIIDIPCGQNRTLQVKVTDGNNTQIIKTVTVYAANCGEPFYVSGILGASTTNNQNNFWVEIPDGGNYGVFSYAWSISGNTSGVGTPLQYNNNIYPKSSGMLRNTSGNPVTVTLLVKVSDIESGLFVIRSRSVVIQPEFEINSCFIKGTEITLANGEQKKIENIVIGDEVLTYNVDTKKTESGLVENIVSPEHTKFVVFNFEKGIENVNTLDHPYYIKDKGWSSYDPKMTQIKYGLKVNKVQIGDTFLLFNKETKEIDEIKLLSQKLLSKTQKTFNLDKVSKNHNFFANGILVHNKSAY